MTTTTIEFTLTFADLEAMRPCDARKYWESSPRREQHPLFEEQELLVYRTGWREEMALHHPTALKFLGRQGFGDLTEETALALIAAAKPERTRILHARAAASNARKAGLEPERLPVAETRRDDWWWERPWSMRDPQKA